MKQLTGYPNIHQELTVKRIGDEGCRIEHFTKQCPADGHVTAFFKPLNEGRWNSKLLPVTTFSIDVNGNAEHIPGVRYYDIERYIF